MVVYALVDQRDPVGHPFGDAVDVYLNRRQAEQELRDILSDEPDWEPFFRIVELRLTTGGTN